MPLFWTLPKQHRAKKKNDYAVAALAIVICNFGMLPSIRGGLVSGHLGWLSRIQIMLLERGSCPKAILLFSIFSIGPSKRATRWGVEHQPVKFWQKHWNAMDVNKQRGSWPCWIWRWASEETQENRRRWQTFSCGGCACWNAHCRYRI